MGKNRQENAKKELLHKLELEDIELTDQHLTGRLINHSEALNVHSYRLLITTSDCDNNKNNCIIIGESRAYYQAPVSCYGFCTGHEENTNSYIYGGNVPAGQARDFSFNYAYHPGQDQSKRGVLKHDVSIVDLEVEAVNQD